MRDPFNFEIRIAAIMLALVIVIVTFTEIRR